MENSEKEEAGQHLQEEYLSPTESAADEGSNNGFEKIDHDDLNTSLTPPSDSQQLLVDVGPTEDGGLIDEPSPSSPSSSPAPLLDLGTPEPTYQPAAEKIEEHVPQTTQEVTAPRPNRAAGPCPGLGWLLLNNMDKRVCELLLWKQPVYSGVCLGSCLVVLLTLACHSIISVVSYFTLLLMATTLSLHFYSYVYTKVMDSGHAAVLSDYMDMEVSLPAHQLESMFSELLHHINILLPDVRDTLLFKDVVRSIKFALIVYACSYIGAWFNGLTLLTLGVTGAFTLPYIYRVNQSKIDSYLSDIRTQINQLIEQMQDKIPFLKLKSD